MKPSIIVVGGSGTGKSTSLRGLDPQTTAVLNTERKQLPFKGAKDFLNLPIKTVAEFHKGLDDAMKSDKVETIIIESFTSLIEMIYREADAKFRGFDVWSQYNKEIDKVLDKSKNTNKHMVFTAIDGVYEDESGVAERYVAVDGNRWKKRVEKEFVVCLFTDNKVTENGVEYRLRTNTLGRDSAKSPMGMFEDMYIPNDLSLVIEKCNEYYN